MPINVQGDEQSKLKVGLKADALLNQLKNSTPQQVLTFFNNPSNFPSLQPGERQILGKMGCVLSYLLKQL